MGVVGEHGVDADYDGVGLPAERLHGAAGGFAGDPVGLAGAVMARRRGNAAVERHGHFHQDEGAFVLYPAGEALVDAAGFRLADAENGFDPCRAQGFHAVAGDVGIGVGGGGHHALESRGDERLGHGPVRPV